MWWPGARHALAFAHHGTSLGLLPTLIGGPWQWQRWAPGPPWADPPAALVVAGWVVVGAALVVTVRVTRGTGWVWAAMVSYVAASETAMMLARSGPDTTYQLAQTLRYTADSAVVLAIGLALLIRAPRRAEPGRLGVLVRRATRPAVAATVTAALVASSLWSTATFTRSWRDNPGADYLATARASLDGHRDVALLDQPVSLMALLPFAAPWNGASRVFAPLADRPGFAESTPELRVLDESGTLVHATVEAARWTVQGPEPGCGTRIGTAGGEVQLGGPLMIWQWTAQVNYWASGDGIVAVGLGAGEPVPVPVRGGLHRVFVRLYGTGSVLSVQPVTPGLHLCIGAGPIGVVLPGTDRVR